MKENEKKDEKNRKKWQKKSHNQCRIECCVIAVSWILINTPSIPRAVITPPVILYCDTNNCIKINLNKEKPLNL